ncbi:MAG: CIA30 family protein [Verrucomicrobiales bacterium]
MKLRSMILNIPFAMAISFSVPAAFGAEIPVTDFSVTENQAFGWRIVDDGVMGGLSKGKVLMTEEGIMRFNGTLSLENNGGFSSVRTDKVALDLSASDGLMIRVKGDGRTYQLRLATDARYRSMEVSFKADFSTAEGQWQEIKIPFSAFTGSFRGIELPDEKLDPKKIERLSVLLGDKKPGPFALEMDWIRAYSEPVPDPSPEK